jgi:UDP-glucose 4-epimerase
MRILLTGANGFIGSALLPLLAAGPHELRALYRSRAPAVLPPGVEAMQGDLLQEGVCERACEGIDVIIHLAAQAHAGSSAAQQQRDTLECTRRLAEAACRAGVQRFLYISSSKAAYPAHSAYAAAKRAAEDLLLDLHASRQLRVVCLRPALVYGPGMRGNLATLLRLLRRRFLPLFPASSMPLGMIALQDCCTAIALALDHPELDGSTWDLHDGQHHALDDLVRQTREYLGLPPPLLRLPRICVQLAARLATVSAPLTGVAFGMGTYYALYKEPCALDERFSRATGFRAQHEFRSQLPALMESLA